jgi:hypothetical protein
MAEPFRVLELLAPTIRRRVQQERVAMTWADAQLQARKDAREHIKATARFAILIRVCRRVMDAGS